MGAWKLINRKLLKKTFLQEGPTGAIMIITKNLDRNTLGTTTVKSQFLKESLENIVSVLVTEGVLFKTGFVLVPEKKTNENNIMTGKKQASAFDAGEWLDAQCDTRQRVLFNDMGQLIDAVQGNTIIGSMHI